MLIIKGSQYLEGIDGIDLLIQPYLYESLDLSKQLDPRHRISIYSTVASIPEYDAHKWFHYLHISGEYINPELPIIESITNAVSELIWKRILIISDRIKMLIFDEVFRDLIRENLHLFVTGISGIEFCFDFEEKHVTISDKAKIINVSDSSFPDFLRLKLKDRPDCLIQEDTTYYSNDYNKRRKSTLKLYNREIWLLKKNNEYTKEFVRNNPYKIRIEFVFKKNYNTAYLTLNNIEGSYHQIIGKFIPYLAKLYRKYFFGKILIDPINHPYFRQIYDIAWGVDTIQNKSLENITQEQKKNRRSTDLQKEWKLIHLLKKEKRKKDKILKELPDTYFMGFNDAKYYTPLDMQDTNNIEYQDEDFTILKDSYILPISNDKDQKQNE